MNTGRNNAIEPEVVQSEDRTIERDKEGLYGLHVWLNVGRIKPVSVRKEILVSRNWSSSLALMTKMEGLLASRGKKKR